MSQLRKVLHEDNCPKSIVMSGGIIAGFSEIITTYPLDTIKTHLQIYPGKYKNLIHCGKDITYNYGYKSLFNGITASLLQVGGKTAIRFTVYDYIKQYFENRYNKSNLVNLLSGIIAGGIEALIWTTPTERVKILQQKNSHKNLKLNIVLYNIVKNKGFFYLYKGTLPTLLKQSTSVGTRFWIYSILKDNLVNDSKNISLLETVFIGGISGIFSAAINQPFDVVKSVIQANESNKKIGIIECSIDIIKKNGIKSLFNGFNARVLRVGIAQAVTFSVYESYVYYMTKIYKKVEKN